MVQLNFDATKVEPQAPMEALPAGDYVVNITGAVMKPTKAGTGQYLELTLKVNGGQYSGRQVYDRLNLVNPNETAVQIAQSTLSAICHAINHMQLGTEQELLGKTLGVKLNRVPRQDKPDEYSNEIKGYMAPEKVQAAPAQQATTQSMPFQAPAPAAPIQPTAIVQQPVQAAAPVAPAPIQAAPVPAAQPEAAKPWQTEAAPVAQPAQQVTAAAPAVDPTTPPAPPAWAS